MKKEKIGLAIIILGLLISIIFAIHTIDKKNQIEKALQEGKISYKEAGWYEKLENNSVRCKLCPNKCTIGEGQRGICQVRENIKGTLYSLVYGNPVSIAVDPIEKKPLYHFLPGSKAYSLATAGCNVDCKYCQNWDIAHRKPEELTSTPLSPEGVVQEAISKNAEVIAFTYNEPTVWYEYMYDIAKIAKEKGLKTAVISNGYINQEPLKELLPYIDAYKIDLKSFNEQTYETLIEGQIEPVLQSIKTISQSSTWLELVYLVVPTYTDNVDEIKSMCEWIKKEIGDSVPIHFSRFWPKYRLTNLPPTPEETIKKARSVCLETGLKYVYTGNIQDIEGSTTFCPENNQPLLIRNNYSIEKNLIEKDGLAKDCKEKIPGVWK